MSEFWYTRGTMSDLNPDYICFEHFSPVHLALTAAFTAIIIAAMMFYKKLDEPNRQKALNIMAILLIADELWKHLGCFATGQWEWEYLPLHLCSINIFVCVWHTLKRDDLSAELLYALCVPGAALALAMPTWTNLPYWNFMSLHSNSVHVLLLMYPLLLLAGGFRPSIKRLPKVFLVLLCECVPIFVLNKILNTNFFFLNGTENNPVLEILASIFGENLYFLGMPFLLVVVWAAMYIPWHLAENKKSKALA
ncbi:MAG: YwaF family protein [Oscillospiraceae bacterium]|nr:YwaF family protein [Oscillospiraceae bacterium]